MFRRGIVLTSIGVLTLVACGNGSGGQPGTGIRGVVKIGPQCPVESLTSPCPDVPFRGDVTATASDGSSTTGTTDAHGRFTLDVPAGTYSVSAVTSSGGMPPTSIPEAVVVREGAYTQVTLEVDTGIR